MTASSHTFTTDPHRLGPRGEAVATLDGITLYVAGAAPGDSVRAHVDHISPHRPEGWASVVEVLARGHHFRTPPCPHAAPVGGRCGGCPLMHLTAEAQHAFKLQRTRATLPDIALHLIPAPHDEAYRNRGNFIAARHESGALLLGSYAPRSHDVVSMDGCRVVDPALNRVHALLETLTRIPVHPEPEALRYVSIRAAPGGGVLVELVLNSESPPWLTSCVKTLMTHPDVVGVAASLNTSRGNALHVSPPTHLAGLSEFEITLGPVTLDVDASTFLQLNLAVATRMYQRAAAWLESPPNVIWDLYCGAGALGLTALDAHPEAQLFGAEVHAGAVERARRSATRMGVAASFAVVDLSKQAPQTHPEPDTVLVNPPRRGLDAPVRDWLCTASTPRQLIYMSCNPKSFARDAKALIASGWSLSEPIEAHDMMPQTLHVELLARFHRG